MKKYVVSLCLICLILFVVGCDQGAEEDDILRVPNTEDPVNEDPVNEDPIVKPELPLDPGVTFVHKDIMHYNTWSRVTPIDAVSWITIYHLFTTDPDMTYNVLKVTYYYENSSTTPETRKIVRVERYKYTIVENSTIVIGAQNLNLELIDITTRPNTLEMAEQWNAEEKYGFTDWATSSKYVQGLGGELNTGQAFYTIFGVTDANKLYMGDYKIDPTYNGLTEATRPRQIDKGSDYWGS